MPAWKRSSWSVVSPARLAEIIERMSAERRPERVAPAALDAALAATGARGGRIVAHPSGAVLAREGDGSEGGTVRADLVGRDGLIGHVEIWGAADEAEAEAALRLVAAVCARGLEHLSLQREQADERERARRLGAAASAVHGSREPREAVARVLSEARTLVDAPAAALLAAGSPSPEVAAYDGMEPLSPADLAALVPPERRAAILDGAGWTGPLADGPLRDRGLASVALVGVGEGASLGILAVFGVSDDPLRVPDLEALAQLAAHAAASLTMSVLQQEIRDLGAVDPLTRFFNSRYFHGRLDQECQRALRAGVPVSIAVLSLDGLEELRAQGREVAAEAAVEALAGHLADRLRAMDVGCRLGPDELAAILPEVEGIDALRVGERLRASLPGVAGLEDGFTLSIGVASFPTQAGRPESLVENAMSALAWARAHGGDRTFLYSADTAEILRGEERGAETDDEAVLTTVASIAAAIDARHPATIHHSENVGRVGALLAAELGLPPDRAEDVRVAGLLHDVGKIGVSDEIVVPDHELTEDEEQELRRHPEIGERMLAGSRLETVGPWVLHHHERMDGTGYPAGLHGEEIPLEARILAVANAFDRLSNGGPTRFPLRPADVMNELERRSGDEFDPVVVAALRSLVGRGAADVTRPAG